MANVFQALLSGDNSGASESGILYQTVQLNGGLVDYLPVCLSVDSMALNGFADAKFKLKISPKKADGTPLYEIEKIFEIWDRYRTYELATVIPNDSSIRMITVGLYPINNKAANAVDFRIRKPKLEFGATKASPWSEGQTFNQRGYNRVFSNNAPTITENTFTTVLFNNPSAANVGITYDTATGRFTVPRKGYYQIQGQLSFAAMNDGARMLVGINKNGANITRSQVSAAAVENTGVPFSVTLDCNAGDYVEIQAFWKRKTGDATTAATVTLNTTPYNWATVVEM
jgi:hypothetical protein